MRLLESLLASIFCMTLVVADVPPSLLSSVQAASNASLLWGPYRPNLYFGVRPRLPKSLLTGLLWSNMDDYRSFQGLRHSCEIGDDMASYGWTEYDGRQGGKQVISDRGMKMELETEFIKVPGQNGGNWGVRVKGRTESPQTLTNIYFYAGLEGFGELRLASEFSDDGIEGDILLEGSTYNLGEFSIEITDGPETNKHPVLSHPSKTHFDKSIYAAIPLMPEQMWQAKEGIVEEISRHAQKLVDRWGEENAPPPAHIYSLESHEGGGLHVVQKTFQGDFEFDVLYNSKSSPEKITSSLITTRSAELSKSFNDRFSTSFPLKPPFTSPRHDSFAKQALSSLLGGIAYFHGSSLVDRKTHHAHDDEDDDETYWQSSSASTAAGSSSPGHLEGPYDLFTATPSRPFFPRGFYWDEGFHLLPVGVWDNDLCLEVLRSWFGLMDEEGWIAREQILGEESRSKVPLEFQMQFPHYANPPTLLMPISAFIERLNKRDVEGVKDPSQLTLSLDDFFSEGITRRYLDNPELARHYLSELYPLLQRHHEWFRRTQSGDIKTWDRDAFSSKEGYRWRGRTPDHCLTSGLDDYPRAKPPHTGELHVDLLSWMGFFARTLKGIAEFLGETEDVDELAKMENAIIRNLDDLHWSEEHQVYCDATIDEFGIIFFDRSNDRGKQAGLVPADSPHLGALLDVMSDPDHLWSDYGLRSLSKSDEYYSTGENYWRGPIWINMNYLALSSLYKNYMTTPGPYQQKAKKIYTDLRTNVVENIVKEWERTGFTWEQYDQETGEGKRSHPFDGWTGASALLIAAEVY